MPYPTDQTPVRLFQDDMGVNAPIIHQRVIARLTAGLYPLFQQDQIPYEPLPETMLGEYGSPVPDLVLYDNESDQTRVIVEVCQTRGVKGDLQKVIQLIDSDLYGIAEGFVYDYKADHWLRYGKGDGGQSEPSAYSTVLGQDLSRYV